VRAAARYDAIVIGAGVAGLTAAARLARGGASVCVLARGVGCTHLAPATIDVLGTDDAGAAVDAPATALQAFVAARPDHPYAAVGVAAIEAALRALADDVAAGPMPGYRYVGDLRANHVLPGPLGAPRRSALVPETMAAGDLRDPAPVCVVGMALLRDFHAGLCAANLAAAGIPARAVRVDVDAGSGRAEASAVTLARRFDEPLVRAAFASALRPRLEPGERVAVPAVLGLRDPHSAWSDLQERLERPVFEIPTLPPSAPGMRLFAALRAAARGAGATLALGAHVVGARRDGDRVTALTVRVAGGEREYEAGRVVLASGGLASGGLELSSDWTLRETALGAAVSGAPARGDTRFADDPAAAQPLARAGVAVDRDLRARALDNVHVVGAALPGADARREGSGEGIALASAHHVGGRP
jgi:glycerol-3-phosphate dehydrogenase subunit B